MGPSLVETSYALLYRLSSVLKRIGVERVLQRYEPVARTLDHLKRLIQREVWVQVQSGLSQGMWMRLRLPGEGAYWQGTHESRVQSAILSAVRPGMVVYDIGSHIGSIALGTARLVGNAGCVVAFDGDPENIARLIENAKRSGVADRLRAVHGAVWSSTCHEGIPFRRGGVVKSRGGVEANGNRPVAGKGEVITVSAITLDDFIAAGGPQPHLVKIDVEGGEYEVLRGGAKLFASQRPLVIAEIHHQEAASQIDPWLDEHRYHSLRRSPQADLPVNPQARDSADFPHQLFAWPSEHEGPTWVD